TRGHSPQVIIRPTRVTHQFADAVAKAREDFANSLLVQEPRCREAVKVRSEHDSGALDLAGPSSGNRGESATVQELPKDGLCRARVPPQEAQSSALAFGHASDGGNAVLLCEPDGHLPQRGQGVHVLVAVQMSRRDARRKDP